jgi:hypothetical protein
MTASNDDLELKDRLALIESMIAEGRRTTEGYGWTFVLWGIAYYVAIAWSGLGHFANAWPVTMVSAAIATAAILWRRRRNHPANTTVRAVSAAWIAMGISMFVLLDALGYSGKLTDWRVFAAIVSTMIGTANATSSLTLKWKLQFACAVIWWGAAIVSCYGTNQQSSIAFLIAIFLCQIVFGVYGIIRESRTRRQAAVHA